MAHNRTRSKMVLEQEDRKKFDELNETVYKEQCVWFMNACWDAVFKNDEKAREDVWKAKEVARELDMKNDEGHRLDEHQAHVFLERLGQTLTVLELRKQLKLIDINEDHHMSLLEYLIFHHQIPIKQVVQPQADPVEVKAAQEKVSNAQTTLQTMQARDAEAKAALQAAEAAAAEAKRCNEELAREQKAFDDKCADLEKKSSEGGVVSRNRAKNELAQMKAKDPLPLRSAKINQEAAVRKSEKQAKLSAAAAAEAEAAAAAATEAYNEAVAYLDDVKSRVGSSEGQFWWMERELAEAAKYLPSNKQHSKAKNFES